jgi:beta-N-acetylhexosaminidase
VSQRPVGEATSAAQARRLAGRRLVIGFEGPEITPELREVARELQPSGFILFQRNVVDPVQVRDLTRALGDLLPAGRPPLITVDQEGGRVQRIREPATRWPTARSVGATELAERVGRGIGRELRAMGFDLNFAPVTDVDSNPDNPVIGDRAFHREADRAGRVAAAFSRGMQAEGVLGCAKHFPGHGDTTVDSHLDLPRIDHPLHALRQTELVPFRHAIAAGVASVMTAHVLFTALDPAWPATLSPGVLTGLLRGELGFHGLLFTDDLEMKAVAGRYPLHDQVRRTIRGTVDVALACRQPDLQLAWFEASIAAMLDDSELAAMAATSERRLDATLARLPDPADRPDLSVVGCDEHLELAAAVAAQAAKGIA